MNDKILVQYVKPEDHLNLKYSYVGTLKLFHYVSEAIFQGYP